MASKRRESSVNKGHLIGLGQGLYTVPETCRILGPSMTPRKIHYWLKGGLLGEPVRRGKKGTPVLLSFEQVLKIKTLQRIRDDLRFSLPRARQALAWIVSNLVADEDAWQELHFIRSSGIRMGIALPDGSGLMEIGTAQGILALEEELTNHLRERRREWEQRAIAIEGYPKLQSNARVLAGAPTIMGTRIETAFVAHLAREMSIPRIREDLFPDVDEVALEEAAKFEGIELVA